MSSLSLAGDTSGAITLAAPAVAGTTTLTLPATTGSVIGSNSSGDIQFNSGYGSVATAYGCRAWVNFNGTGTVAIRASGNVTNITDNGTGDYTVNFTTAMSDANYAAVASSGDASTDARIAITTTLATGSYKITTRTIANTLFDTLTVQSAIFR